MKVSNLQKRLLPLYLAAFLQSLIFWFANEKAFMRQIGFSDFGIGVMVAASSLFVLLFEIPGGILADRWSRKGVLIMASFFMIASSIIGGLSQVPIHYIVCTMVWGISFALYSGAYGSIIYDTILEEFGNSKKYQRLYGYYRVMDCLGLILGALLGGAIAGHFGYRLNYFITIPVAILAGATLLFFKEPKIHKTQESLSITDHTTSTLRAIFHRRELYVPVALQVLATIIYVMVFEFSQLWFIALAMSAFAFGLGNAVVLISLGAGGVVAKFVSARRSILLAPVLVFMVAASLGLIFIKNAAAIIICQTVLVTVSVIIEVIISHQIHDQLPSHVRAGASSIVSAVSRILVMPLGLLFGYISSFSVFKAGWLLFAFVVGIVVLFSLQKLSPKFRPGG